MTKNLLLKDGMGLRMKNFNVNGGSLKNMILSKTVHEKPMHRRNCLNEEVGLRKFADLRDGSLAKKGVFLKGYDMPNAHYVKPLWLPLDPSCKGNLLTIIAWVLQVKIVTNRTFAKTGSP